MPAATPLLPISNARRMKMPREKKIAYVTWGCASQITTFQDLAHQIDDMLYLRELDRHDLDRYAAIVIPDSTNTVELARHAAQLNAYVRNGGFLIIFGAKGVRFSDTSWGVS